MTTIAVGDVRSAYLVGDAEASRSAHEARRSLMGHPTASEEHSSEAAGRYIKSLVYGGMDGILTTFAVVSASAGGGLSIDVVLLLGFANHIADAFSMGFGDYLGSRAEKEHAEAEHKRESWEMLNYPDGEKAEMVELYIKRGMTMEDATTVIHTLAKYPELFVDVMMVEELGIMPPDPEDVPWKNGLVTFIAFIIFGFVPLFPYVVFKNVKFATSFDLPFVLSIIATALTLLSLGWVKAGFLRQNKLHAALLMLVNGSIAAGLAYAIGYIVNLITTKAL